ncbi:MAG: hypothetical protein C0497_09960 [Gemmatimonas sp.]|nr:hypothetical protein [Gemmatimonas sp.]
MVPEAGLHPQIFGHGASRRQPTPAERISDLQKLEVGIRGGHSYKVSDLLLAVGARNGVRSTGTEGDAAGRSYPDP